MMKAVKREQRKAAPPEIISQIYGIPVGTLANWRYQKKGPKFFKSSKRRVLYFIKDVEEYLTSEPVQTIDSAEVACR